MNAAARVTNLTVRNPMGLMEFLMAEMPGKSRTSIKSLLTGQQIRVNDQTVTQFDHPLAVGDRVGIHKEKGGVPGTGKRVETGARPRAASSNSLHGLQILYEDADLIVVDKPAGLLSISTENEKERTAYSILMDYIRTWNARNHIFVLHRLDRETSGVMMFAKNKATQDKLQRNWQDAVKERHYIVLVEGVIKKDGGTAVSWLQENKARMMYSTTNPGPDAKEAITHWRVLRRSSKNTLLEADLETGRKNQIRVHMMDMGHSLVGDEKYGATSDPIKRLGLHAQSLAFIHPASGELVRFESPVPASFEALLKE